MTPDFSQELTSEELQKKVLIQISTFILVAIIIMMGFILYWGMHTTTIHANETLKGRIVSIYQKLDQHIVHLLEDNRLLAKNDLIVNAFVDDENRNKYLMPLVENFIEGHDVIALSVVDFSGKAIFTTAGKLPEYNRLPELRAALSVGKSSTYFQEDDHHLIVITPISYYASPLGSIIVEYDMEKIVDLYTPGDTSTFIKLLHKGAELYAFRYDPQQKYYTTRYQGDPSASPIAQMGVTMEMGLLRASYFIPLQNALLQLALIGVLIFAVGLALAFAISRKVTTPLLHMTKQYRELNATLEERVQNSLSQIHQQEQFMLQQSRQAAMGEMIGAIAHQWRQPLNVIGLYIQDLQDAYDYGEVDKKYIEETVEKTMQVIHHMSDTIDDFRNFFKPNKSKKRFDIQEEIEHAINFVKAQFSNHNITIVDTTRKGYLVDGFPNEFKQVILNVLSNSKDAIVEMQEKTPGLPGRIILSADPENDKIRISIQDNGGGIGQEVMEKIFDPYFTTKDQGKGTGIGLYMSQTIIHDHMGGSIRVSNYDHGALFVIELPLAQEERP